MNRGMIVGLSFIFVPIIIILGYLGYQWFFSFPMVMSKGIVDAAPGAGGSLSVTDNTSELLIGAGTCFMSICYGIAKLITSMRGYNFGSIHSKS